MKFSIIIPVYNTAPYLRACLDSVLDQTMVDWECICVDDGSTDDSAKILDEYVQKDGRVRAIHQVNAGVSAARNIGLAAARGDWVWFVDSDDLIHRQSLELFSIAAYDFDGIDALTTDYAFSPLTKQYDLSCASNLFNLVKTHESRILRTFRGGMCHVIFRREKIGDLRFEKYIMGEDALFNLTFFWKTNCWAMCNVPLYYYRQREGSACNSVPSLGKVLDYLDVECRYLELMRDRAELWRLDDMREFFEYNSAFIFRTYQNMYFALPLKNRKQLFDRWLRLQCLSMALYPETALWIRFAIGLLKLIPSTHLATCIFNCRSTYCHVLSNMARRKS